MFRLVNCIRGQACDLQMVFPKMHFNPPPPPCRLFLWRAFREVHFLEGVGFMGQGTPLAFVAVAFLNGIFVGDTL